MSSAPKKSKILSLANLKVGVLCALLAQPFEVIRTSSIINQHKITNLNFKGMLSIIKLIKDSEGIKGFFRGGVLSIFKTTFGYAFFFTGLESMNSISSKNPLFDYLPAKALDFSNALCSKTATTFLVSPINVLKTRFEVVGNNEYASIREGVVKIWKTEGSKGFYRGILATVIRDGPFSGIQYALYRSILDLEGYYKNFRERMRMNYYDENKGVINGNNGVNINSEIDHRNQIQTASKSVIAFAAAASSAFAIMITYPFDNIRVRYQIEKGRTKTLKELCREVYLNEGVGGFYKGYLPRLLKKICSGALTWSLYEHIKKGNNLN